MAEYANPMLLIIDEWLLFCFSLIDWIKRERYNGCCPKTRKSFERVFAVQAEEMKDVMGMRVVTMKCGCQRPVHVTPKQ